jgi:hypothetical protein
MLLMINATLGDASPGNDEVITKADVAALQSDDDPCCADDDAGARLYPADLGHAKTEIAARPTLGQHWRLWQAKIVLAVANWQAQGVFFRHLQGRNCIRINPA